MHNLIWKFLIRDNLVQRSSFVNRS